MPLTDRGALPRGWRLSRTLRADAVVVGTGAGGAPAAAALAEAGLSVVMVESGSHWTSKDFTGVEGDLFFRLGRLAATQDGSLNLYAGHCVGGSTVVNDALCWRTPPEILAEWRERDGLAAFETERFAPFLDRAWADVHASPTARSHINRNAHALERGARALGWAAEPMHRNVRGCAKLGLCNFGCPANAKQSTLLSHVPRARAAGARLLADTRVLRVLSQAGRVLGVAAERTDPETGEALETLEIHAPLVCLAAGVLGTPPLLLRSGFERAGRGIQFHSSVHVTARFAEPIHGYFGPTMAYAISEFADVLGRGGPGFMIENTTVHPLVTAQNLPAFGDAHEAAMAALPHLAKAVVVLRDRARGTVSVDDAGEGRFDLALVDEDLSRMAEGMVATARAYLAAGAEEVWLPVDGLDPIRSEADLARVEGRVFSQTELFSLYAVHLFGGASMARGAADGFCDERGEAFDLPGLYVMDAAGLPGNTGANPQITVMANALRIADGIVRRGAAS